VGSSLGMCFPRWCCVLASHVRMLGWSVSCPDERAGGFCRWCWLACTRVRYGVRRGVSRPVR
jgi:hypothetical protein